MRHGDVEAIDLDDRELRFRGGGSMGYDHLVFAPGAVTADFGVPGVAEHALPLTSVTDAVTIRNHVLEQFEAAAGGSADGGELTIAVAGGGAMGVELAGAALRDVLLRRDFAELADRRVRVVSSSGSTPSSLASPSPRGTAPGVSSSGLVSSSRSASASPAIPHVAPARSRAGARPNISSGASMWRPTGPFRYGNKGSMATIGRNAAMNEFPVGLRLRGFPAWVAWLFPSCSTSRVPATG